MAQMEMMMRRVMAPLARSDELERLGTQLVEIKANIGKTKTRIDQVDNKADGMESRIAELEKILEGEADPPTQANKYQQFEKCGHRGLRRPSLATEVHPRQRLATLRRAGHGKDLAQRSTGVAERHPRSHEQRRHRLHQVLGAVHA